MKGGERASWSGHLAFVLAAAASAIGLGNLWRFPYLTAKYGGGVFILAYLILSLTLGLAMLVTEIAIGRKSRQSQLTAFTTLGFRRWAWVGWLSTIVPLLIAPYYAVIGGWVVRYFAASLLQAAGAAAPAADTAAAFAGFTSSPVQTIGCMVVFIALTIGVILAGVKNGIERANLVLMPALFLAAVALAVWIACQPGALAGIRYYLVPDFSSCPNPGKVLLGAMGQMFFSLSLAMGIMVTYGSYMRRGDSIGRSAVRICLADAFAAVLAGFIVIPATFLAGAPAAEGPGLMFVTLPDVFSRFGAAGSVIGFGFFSLVLFAALTSAISMSEACVAAVCDGFGLPRRASALLVGAWCILLGVFSAVSMDFLSFVDGAVNSIVMPVTAIGIALFAGWALRPAGLVREFVRSRRHVRLVRFYGIAMRFVVPLLIAAILVSEFCRVFKIGGWSI